jgi:transcriptional regulator with XRE-family HTH domain
MNQNAPTVTPGAALKSFRGKQELSRRQLANSLGVDRMTVWRWEEDKRRIDDDILPRVVEYTGIPASTLRPDLARLLAPAPAQ